MCGSVVEVHEVEGRGIRSGWTEGRFAHACSYTFISMIIKLFVHAWCICDHLVVRALTFDNVCSLFPCDHPCCLEACTWTRFAAHERVPE